MGLNPASTQRDEASPAHDRSHTLLFVRDETANHCSSMRVAICGREPALLYHKSPMEVSMSTTGPRPNLTPRNL